MIKILLVDDHKLIRRGLCLLLDQIPDMKVVGEADHGREALARCAELEIDVVVMDVAMPELNGIEATRRIRSRYRHIQVVALSMYDERRILTEMLQAGASALVFKASATEELEQAIRAVQAGERYIATEIKAIIGVESSDASSVNHVASISLTNRELEVLQLVAEGGTTRSIGTRLGISAKTVDTHRQNIMRKLNLRTVAELTKYAVREGITTL